MPDSNTRYFAELIEGMQEALPKDAFVAKGQDLNLLPIRTKSECAVSMEKFAQTYFPDIFTAQFCDLHKDFFQSVEDIILKRQHRKNYFVRAAPRGHGKSQILSFLLPMWCTVYRYKSNILLVSDTMEQARAFMAAIKSEFEDNELLAKDFGYMPTKITWRTDRIITKNKVQIAVKGAGQKLRGIKYGSLRPDIIIVDDLENDEAVETEAQRKKLYNWFMRVLLPAGDPNVDIIYIGTVLHYESLLQKLLKEPRFSMWDRRVYRAIIRFSDSFLWDDWEKMLLDETNENAEEMAYDFYRTHKKEMLRGTEVLWPGQDKDAYYKMMLLKVADSEAFQSEYQNEPIDPSTAEFQEEWFDYYDELPRIEEVFGACDPSLGKAKSDRAAIIWAGKDRDGYLYVLDATLGKYKPDVLIDMLIAGAIRYRDNLTAVVIETVQFQAMFKDEVAKRGLQAGIQIPICEFNDQTPKEIRLRGLVPKICFPSIHITSIILAYLTKH